MNSNPLISAADEKQPLHVLDNYIKKERRRRNLFSVIRDLVIVVIVIVLLFSIVLGLAVVQGDSMNPSIKHHSVAVFNRLSNHYESGDIVIFRATASADPLIKRVVAMEGDVVDIDSLSGTVTVNQVPYHNDEVIGKTETREHGISFPYTVPEDCLFVLGDNREVAADSRDFGAVNKANIIGKIYFVLKPISN
ncbi:MAG TPA: signal peptidase I [Clostridiales bacterium]|nr:signal peptidase I [Clostridiales bacterium]